MAITHISGPLAQGSASIKVVTSATTLTPKDNGKTIILSGGTGAAITLYAPTSGHRLKFIVGAAFSTDWTITSTAANIVGNIMEVGAIQAVTASTTLTLEDGAEALGDYLDFISDGTYWYVSGGFSTAASVTPS